MLFISQAVPLHSISLVQCELSLRAIARVQFCIFKFHRIMHASLIAFAGKFWKWNPYSAKTWKAMKVQHKNYDRSFRVPRVIHIGMDFAGMGTLAIAARRTELKSKVTFASDNNDACQKVLRAMGVSTIFGDVATRSVKDAPSCHIFSMSPPCVTFSSEGKREGTRDPAGTGKLCQHSLKYIKHKHPRLVIYENVANVARQSRFKKVM